MSLNEKGPASNSIEAKARGVDQLSSKIGPEHNVAAAAVKFHPLADMFPLMEGADFDALVADIKANGLQVDIACYEGMILDGRNRYRACLAANVVPTFDDVDCFVRDPVAYVISANIRRRHLTAEQKDEVLAKLVAAQPRKSDRELAKQAGVSHPTIAKARRKAEATGKALPVEKRVGADGKARKLPTTKVKVKPDELVTAAAEIGIPESAIKAHGPQQAEAIRRIVQRKRKNKRERIAAEMEGLANKLIELDLETARTLLEVLEIDDRHRIIRLTDALVRGIGRATCQALLSECRDGQ